MGVCGGAGGGAIMAGKYENPRNTNLLISFVFFVGFTWLIDVFDRYLE